MDSLKTFTQIKQATEPAQKESTDTLDQDEISNRYFESLRQKQLSNDQNRPFLASKTHENFFKTQENVRIALHPSLSYRSTLSPRPCNATPNRTSSRGGNGMRNQTRSKKKVTVKAQDVEENGNERLITDTADGILYRIVAGKWGYKNIVFDEDNTYSTKKVCLGQCSNAHCVREMENQRRRMQQIEHDSYDHNEGKSVFEDGNLPSYHSMLSLWQNNYNSSSNQRAVTASGFPVNETEFLRMWRDCRRNPTAYGIKPRQSRQASPVYDDTDSSQQRQASRRRNIVNLLKERLPTKAKVVIHPANLASREFYSTNSEPVASKEVREWQKCRYENLRKLYPHLPALRNIDYKVNPSTVKLRLKQAEEWHSLIAATNKPQPLCHRPRVKDFMSGKSGATTSDSYGDSDYTSPEQFCQTPKIPRYASSTTSFLNKRK